MGLNKPYVKAEHGELPTPKARFAGRYYRERLLYQTAGPNRHERRSAKHRRRARLRDVLPTVDNRKYVQGGGINRNHVPPHPFEDQVHD